MQIAHLQCNPHRQGFARDAKITAIFNIIPLIITAGVLMVCLRCCLYCVLLFLVLNNIMDRQSFSFIKPGLYVVWFRLIQIQINLSFYGP